MDADTAWRVLVDSLSRRPDSRLLDRPDWVQLITPSSPFHTENKVLRARLSAREADRRIAEVVTAHRARPAGLTWIVDHRSTPDDLGPRLERHGVVFDSCAQAMVRSVPAEAPPALPHGVSIRPAGSDDAPAIARISAQNFGGGEAFVRFVEGWVRASFADPKSPTRHWLALRHGEPVGQCTLRLLPGLGYLQGGSVLPSARGHGIYRAMTWARLAELRSLGHRTAIVWADQATSAPIVARMGFTAVTTARYHRLPDPT